MVSACRLQSLRQTASCESLESGALVYDSLSTSAIPFQPEFAPSPYLPPSATGRKSPLWILRSQGSRLADLSTWFLPSAAPLLAACSPCLPGQHPTQASGRFSAVDLMRPASVRVVCALSFPYSLRVGGLSSCARTRKRQMIVGAHPSAVPGRRHREWITPSKATSL